MSLGPSNEILTESNPVLTRISALLDKSVPFVGVSTYDPPFFISLINSSNRGNNNGGAQTLHEA